MNKNRRYNQPLREMTKTISNVKNKNENKIMTINHNKHRINHMKKIKNDTTKKSLMNSNNEANTRFPCTKQATTTTAILNRDDEDEKDR